MCSFDVSMKKVALITGVNGQDGAYLAQFLLKKNYKVIGTTKNSSRSKNWRLERLKINKKIINCVHVFFSFHFFLFFTQVNKLLCYFNMIIVTNIKHRETSFFL